MNFELVLLPLNVRTTTTTPTDPGYVWVRFQSLSPDIAQSMSKISVTPPILNLTRAVWVGLIPGDDIEPEIQNGRIRFMSGASYMRAQDIPPGVSFNFDKLPLVPTFPARYQDQALELMVPPEDLVQPTSLQLSSTPNGKRDCVCHEVYHYIMPSR